MTKHHLHKAASPHLEGFGWFWFLVGLCSEVHPLTHMACDGTAVAASSPTLDRGAAIRQAPVSPPRVA